MKIAKTNDKPLTAYCIVMRNCDLEIRESSDVAALRRAEHTGKQIIAVWKNTDDGKPTVI